MQNITYEFVEKPVTAWGGMRMMKELLDRTGIKEFMEKLPLSKPGLNRRYFPIQIKGSKYKAADWKEERRLIVVRKNIKKFPKASGKLLLFKDSQLKPVYHYSVFVTNLDLPAEQIRNMYKDRGVSENRIKKLKYNFAIDGFCMKKFWSTEASFRMVMVAYNLMSLFRQMVLQDKTQATPNTLKFIPSLREGSWIVKNSREKVLKISTAGRKRLWLEGLFLKVSQLFPPYSFYNA